MPDVIVQRLDFALDRIFRVLRGEKRRLAKSRIVTGHGVIAGARNWGVIVGADEFFIAHVPVGDETVIPFGRVAVLRTGEEGAAFFDQRFQRLGGKKFQIHVTIVRVADRETIFTELGEPDLIQVIITFRSHRFDRGRGREFSFDGIDLLFGAQGDFGEEIRGHGHAGHDLRVNAAFVHEDLADAVIAVGPAKLERVGKWVSPRLPAGASVRLVVRLPPICAVGRGFSARCRRVDENFKATSTASTPTGVLPVFELRIARGGRV